MSKYYTWNKRGSRIVIDTGYKTFDNYIVCINRGNVVGGGQLSCYIRPYTETKCNGYDFKLGELRDTDLSNFNNLWGGVSEYVKSITNTRPCILYKFYTYKQGRENVVGYIVEQDGQYKTFVYGNDRIREKKLKCLDYIIQILKEEYEKGY